MSHKRTNIESYSRRALFNTPYVIFLLLVLVLGACRDSGGPASPNEPNESAVAESLSRTKRASAHAVLVRDETSLFDGRTLGRWAITDFGGQGNVYVKDGCIFMEMGNDMTGVTWTGPVVKMNYEIRLEAKRVTGSDFFCGLTFPVGDNPCSLILGGWGGEVCGLSNIDYYDAANNETTRIIQFEQGRWYYVRLRVTPSKIEAWLDDEKIVDIETTGRKIDIRPEMDLVKPLGIATWQTAGAVRNISLQTITDLNADS